MVTRPSSPRAPVHRSPPPRPRTTPVVLFHSRTVVRQENFLTLVNVDGMARVYPKTTFPGWRSQRAREVTGDFALIAS